MTRPFFLSLSNIYQTSGFHPPLPKLPGLIDIRSNWFSVTVSIVYKWFSLNTHLPRRSCFCGIQYHIFHIKVFTILYLNSLTPTSCFSLSIFPRLLNIFFFQIIATRRFTSSWHLLSTVVRMSVFRWAWLAMSWSRCTTWPASSSHTACNTPRSTTCMLWKLPIPLWSRLSWPSFFPPALWY